MKKISMKPGEMLAPIPAVMVSCGDDNEADIITIAWTGIINSNPPMTYISVRPSRHSHSLIEKNGQFVINLVSQDLVFAADHCGNVSGTKEDKFEAMHLTKVNAEKVLCPLIEESPVNIECKIVGKRNLGSHDMYIAEIVAVHVNEDLFEDGGRIAMEKADLVAYVHGEYYSMNAKLGGYGYSVMKPKTKSRRKSEGKPYGGKSAHFKDNEIKAPEEKPEVKAQPEEKKPSSGKRVATRTATKKETAAKTEAVKTAKKSSAPKASEKATMKSSAKADVRKSSSKKEIVAKTEAGKTAKKSSAPKASEKATNAKKSNVEADTRKSAKTDTKKASEKKTAASGKETSKKETAKKAPAKKTSKK